MWKLFSKKTESTYGKLTAQHIVIATLKKSKQALILIYVCNGVLVNTLLRMPTCRSTKIVIDATKEHAKYIIIFIWFPTVFQPIYSVSPR